MFKIKKNKNLFKKGFSIGEVLMAAFVLTVGIVAVLTLLVSSINHLIDARKNIIAAKLAEEGIELVRNMRDNNAVTSGCRAFANTGSCKQFPASSKDDCRIDYRNESPSCNSAQKNLLCIDKQGRYYHKDGVCVGGSQFNTEFQRIIIFDFDPTDSNNDDNPDKTLVVKSIVSWNGSEPSADINACKTSSKCAYAQATLRDVW